MSTTLVRNYATVNLRESVCRISGDRGGSFSKALWYAYLCRGHTSNCISTSTTPSGKRELGGGIPLSVTEEENDEPAPPWKVQTRKHRGGNASIIYMVELGAVERPEVSPTLVSKINSAHLQQGQKNNVENSSAAQIQSAMGRMRNDQRQVEERTRRQTAE